MLNRSASLAMSTCGIKALPGIPDIKRHSPSTLYLHDKSVQKEGKFLSFFLGNFGNVLTEFVSWYNFSDSSFVFVFTQS